MRAIRISHPKPKLFQEMGEALKLEKFMVDFPERKLSYAIFDCKTSELERCVSEVRNAVNLHEPGTEPKSLEIRLGTPY